MEALYCENGECRVMMFGTGLDEEPENNCPGCGQFGRKKGKQ